MEPQTTFHWRALLGALILVGLAVATGCREQVPATPTPAPLSTAVPLPTGTQPAAATETAIPLPTDTVEPTPVPTISAVEQATTAATRAMANALGISVNEVVLIEAEPVDWPDGCLGLGNPDETCPQVVTPGFRVKLRVGDEPSVFRTDFLGAQVRMEEPETDAAAAVVTAQEALAAAAGYSVEEVQVLSTAPVEWPDGCLGLGGPDELCLQAITPGYEIVLEVGGRQFVLRADLNGDALRFASAAEAQAGDRVMRWEREGGIAGFCDRLVLTVEGAATGGSCDEIPLEGALLPEQQAQLSAWVATYRPAYYVIAEPAVADAMTVTLALLGAGTQAPSANEIESMLAFAGSVHSTMASASGEVLPPEAWVRVLVPALDMSFPVRAGWTQQDNETTWQTGNGTVHYETVSGLDQPETLLPAGSQITRQEAVNLGWATGQRLQVSLAAAAGTSTYYLLVDTDGNEHLFAAAAATAADLWPLADDLGRMVSAVTFSEGEDKVAGPTQVVVDFLAAWLYDEPGLETYLSPRLQTLLAAGGSLEEALGIASNDYRTFSVEWISTGDGRSQVRITLTFAAGTQVRVLDLIQDAGVWVIDATSS